VIDMPIENEPVIGLEIHIQVATKSKMFCACMADVFGCEPGRSGKNRIEINDNICPVCVGLPGVLPVLNKKAVEHALRLALALGMDIEVGLPPASQRLNLQSCFHRKSYFYPDLPKGYQITQHDEPIGRDGRLFESLYSTERQIHIKQIHLEEDPGASDFKRTSSGTKLQMIDFNRCGVPLIEVVTGPEFHSAEEATAFFKLIWMLARYLRITKGQMEKGNLRCDANVSIREKGSNIVPNYRREIKNINSFEKLFNAIAAEIKEQEAHKNGIRNINPGIPAELERGHADDKNWPVAIESCTLNFDEESGILRPMRRKESVNQYRYFREPDILPLDVPFRWVDVQRARMPVSMWERFKQFTKDFRLSDVDAESLLGEPDRLDYFDQVVKRSVSTPTEIFNWIKNEILPIFRQAQTECDEQNLPAPSFLEFGVPPEALSEILAMLGTEEITRDQARVLLKMVKETGRTPLAIVGSPEWVSSLPSTLLTAVCEKVLNEEIESHPGLLNDYDPQQSKVKPINYLVGRVKRKLKDEDYPGGKFVGAESIRDIIEMLIQARRAMTPPTPPGP
jgi:aspartyl-tRNA(Asn)/glutamyl-tRNA(Gln) amidotransferase subunit B